MLWFSAPSRLNQRFEGNGTQCGKHHEVTHLAITATFTAPYGGFNTPRAEIGSCGSEQSTGQRLGRGQGDDWLGTGRHVFLPCDDCGADDSDEGVWIP